jgi:L-lactate dehydrogenase complex protein LldG
MEESTTKEKILKEVRNALISKQENPFKDVDFSKPVYKDLKELPEVEFAIQLNEAGGVFIYCENEKAIAENLKLLKQQKGWDHLYSIDEQVVKFLVNEGINVDNDPENFIDQKIGITRCEYLISRFGSVMVSSATLSGRRMFAYPEVHIVFAAASQVVPELKDALKSMTQNYKGKFPSQISIITGPSRTADIEKTLVMGAHGPRELYVFMVEI